MQDASEAYYYSYFLLGIPPIKPPMGLNPKPHATISFLKGWEGEESPPSTDVVIERERGDRPEGWRKKGVLRKAQKIEAILGHFEL